MFYIFLVLLMTTTICVKCDLELTQPSSMVINPGGSLTINCKVSGYSVTDNSYATGWIRQPAGKTLEWINHIWGGGNTYQKESLKSKFSISKDASSSTVTLQGQNLLSEDTAVYFCVRSRGRLGHFDYWGKGTSVTVTSGVQSPPASIFAMSQCGSGSDGFHTLGCLTSGFSPPDALKFKWTDSQGKELTEFTQYPVVQTSGSYTSVSHVQVKASDWSSEKPFTCTAEHPAGPKNLIIKKPGPKAPTISLVKVYDGKSIMCVLEDFYPNTFTLNWKEGGTDVNGLTLPARQSMSGLYTAGSIFQVTKSKWESNMEYMCEVMHNGKSYEVKHKFTAALTVKIKGPNVRDLFIHNRAVMECVITGDNKQEVKDAKVLWRLNGTEANAKKVEDAEVQKTGQQYTKISTFNFSQTCWFSDCKVECSTTWNKINISDEISINKGAKKVPTIQIYKPDKTDSPQVFLVCEINNSPLGDVYVMWTKGNNNQYIEGNSTSPIHKTDNSMSVFSILTVSEDEYKQISVFSCAVKHAGMENSSTPHMTSTSKSKDNCPQCPA